MSDGYGDTSVPTRRYGAAPSYERESGERRKVDDVPRTSRTSSPEELRDRRVKRIIDGYELASQVKQELRVMQFGLLAFCIGAVVWKLLIQ